jgi:hypothetical protein
MPVTKKASVRRLHVTDPYNLYSQYGAGFGLNPSVATFTPEFDKLTNNPNVIYQPQAGQSTVAVRQRAPKPIGAASGHMKAFPPNRQTLFGGKTLRRR